MINQTIRRYILFILLAMTAGCIQPIQAPDSEASAEIVPELAALELDPDVDVQTVASVLGREDVFLLDVQDKEVIIYCHSGARSSRVTQFLNEQGYTNIHNMLGGIMAWQEAGFEIAR